MGLSADGFTLLKQTNAPAGIAMPPMGNATASGVPLLIKAAAFHADILANLRSDWGDLRLSFDIDGLTQLPLEIITSGGIATHAWTLVPNAAEGLKVYPWGNKPAATQPAVGDAFGRNAVWGNDVATLHFQSSGLDSTGTNAFGVGVGTPVYGSGIVGNALVLDGSNALQDLSFSGESGSNVLISAWVKPTNVSSGTYVLSGSLAGINNKMTLIVGYQVGFFNIFDDTLYPTGDPADTQIAATIDVWQRITYTSDGTTLKGFKNGVEVVSVSASLSNNADTYTVGSNGVFTPSTLTASSIDEFRYANRYVSENQESIEYQNQSATGAWWLAEDAISGGFNPIWASFANQLIQ